MADGAPSGTAQPPRAAVARNETRGTVLAADLELATSFWARFMGLMGRRALRRASGLWLSSTNGIHMLFMRFAIDAVFLGREGPDGARPVLSVHRRVRPWIGLVPLVRGAAGVLELPVGTIDDTGTVPGDLVRLG